MHIDTRKLIVAGQVQGVGFRPFVYRLARDLGLRGWVRNTLGRVEILVQARRDTLARFSIRLFAEAPPLAKPVLVADEDIENEALTNFRILGSGAGDEMEVHVPPDYFTCENCRAELRDPADRRYRYPFINCTQCGPRYTIIDRLPYDRSNTSMAGFALCPACRAEYEDPRDRRFHAEPVACPACGPSLRFTDGAYAVEGSEAVLAATVSLLNSGGIAAVRGIGGYHLLCNANDAAAVKRLRGRKHRPHKPLAVMVPPQGEDGCEVVRHIAMPSAAELALLQDPRRPIVLCRKRPNRILADSIAPDLEEVGLFLPYSPLHHVLLDDFGGPLVATSGNISGEPVLTGPDEAERRLGAIADAFVHHNRAIRRPADDAVYRVIGGEPRPLRLGRGNAPLEFQLRSRLARPTLAVGGHMKNTVALAWGDRVVVAPHIGDLDSPRGLAVFEQVIGDLQRLYGVSAAHIVCDAHPGYASGRWARSRRLPLTKVYHHAAHASAVAGEFRVEGDMLVFTWDGVGYGEDGTLWGGEGLLGRPGNWRRVTSFRPFRLPGGDKAGREPWRAAAALCWELGLNPREPPAGFELARKAWERNLNCPPSTSVGRLFDAAAGLTGVCARASFEGHGPMFLEAVARRGEGCGEALPIQKDGAEIWRADWAPLVSMLMDGRLSVSERATRFHAVLAQTLSAFARRVADEHGVGMIGLGGGVFQNRLLTERAVLLLENDGFKVLVPVKIPCNDAGISYGQLVEVAGETG